MTTLGKEEDLIQKQITCYLEATASTSTGPCAVNITAGSNKLLPELEPGPLEKPGGSRKEEQGEEGKGKDYEENREKKERMKDMQEEEEETVEVDETPAPSVDKEEKLNFLRAQTVV